jgi:Domain of unknown function (DUF4157)
MRTRKHRSENDRPAAAPATPAPAPVPTAGPADLLTQQRGVGNAAVVQRVAASTVDGVLRGPGTALDEPVRQEMEARLGADFSDVRVHADSTAQRSAAELGAHAYTTGHHVVLGADTVDRHVLAHELVHVIQQRTGPVAGTDLGAGLRVSDPADHDEQAADRIASRALRGPVPDRRDHADHPAHHDGAPAVQRMLPTPAGQSSTAVPTSYPVVNLTVDANGVVTRVEVVGRPEPRPYQGREGRHTTAWGLLADRVRRAVVGSTLAAAATQVQALAAEAATLQAPGLSGDRQGRFTRAASEAARLAGEAQTQAGAGNDPAGAQLSLQTAIGAYLTARNYAPLASASVGPVSAGAGEGTTLGTLRAVEANPAGTAAGEVQRTIWQLLDVGVLAAAGRSVTDLPGGNDTTRSAVERTRVDIIERHLREISHAYPAAYNQSGLATAAGIGSGTLRTALTGAGIGAAAADRLIAAISPQPVQMPANNLTAGTYDGGRPVLAQVELVLPAAPAGTGTGSRGRGTGRGGGPATSRGGGRGGAATGQPAAAAAPTPTVRLAVRGRGSTLYSAQASHLTAHVAVVRGLERTVNGKPLGTALASLLDLARDLRALPTYVGDDDFVRPSSTTAGPVAGSSAGAAGSSTQQPSVDQLAGQLGSVTLDEVPGDEAQVPRDRYNEVKQDFVRAENAARALNPGTPQEQVEAIQDLAGAYLAMRNMLPLVSSELGPAGSRGEPTTAGVLESARGSAEQLRTAAWELLDRPAARAAADHTTTPVGTVRWDWVRRLAIVIAVHLDAIARAWPDAYTRSRINNINAITAYVTGPLNIRLDAAEMTAFEGYLRTYIPDLDEGALPTASRPTGRGAGRRPRDSDAYDPRG